MENWPEKLWEGLKQAKFALTGDLQQKLLKSAFLTGMYCGHQLGLQSTKLTNEQCHNFNRELLLQIKGAMAQIGDKPPHINLEVGKIITPNRFGG